DNSNPLPVNEIKSCTSDQNMITASWPENISPVTVKNRLKEGPAKTILKRTFEFTHPDHFYTITFDFRAEDPWVGINDEYRLGKNTNIKLDLEKLNADNVYHQYTYNARTFSAGGLAEDSTLEPPQHPIATIGPVWRDIWYNGGPFAFVYNSQTDRGLGFAAVNGSDWHTPKGVSPESQNIHIHGHKKLPGKVFTLLPTDAGTRRWALVVGPPSLRNALGRMTRSHADIPFDNIRKNWILDWESDSPEFSAGAADVYLDSHFNRHFFNPTTYPRRVSSQIENAFKYKQVKSRDLAVLAYIFTDPDYWPGPDSEWQIGNPNFHTDMYNIPLKIGLLMQDHPHAERWTRYGVNETYRNLMKVSYPNGAWQESLSYSKYFFDVADNIKLLEEYNITNGFKHWPRTKEVARYLTLMHTPVDPRYGARQIAPIGDTSPGNYIDKLNHIGAYFENADNEFADQLKRFPENWNNAVNLKSEQFPGFGAMLRGNQYDPRYESFVTIKAGPARNHYQGDELAFHFCGLSTPLVIDHACHYSPRPWSAAIHNRPDMNNKRPVAVAQPLAFRTSPTADLFVAEEQTTRISEVPIQPHETVKPGWEYPTSFLPKNTPWKMRRFLLLVKHDPASSNIPDYIVVRDEISSPEPVWWNLHVLGRKINGHGPVFHFPGQLDVDLNAHFLEPDITEIEKRQWGWNGNSAERRQRKGDDYEKHNFGRLIPKGFQQGSWNKDDGERTMWLRVKGKPGVSKWLVVLMPNLQNSERPEVNRLSETSVEISLGRESEVIHIGTEATPQAGLEQNNEINVLLQSKEIKPLTDY
ncbi:MAG: hypothetical protein K9N52_11430, partial [Verrucomicrobia bacterium]|nr:hypothetical protein [Verrucomicrobiota bacterium]